MDIIRPDIDIKRLIVRNRLVDEINRMASEFSSDDSIGPASESGPCLNWQSLSHDALVVVRHRSL